MAKAGATADRAAIAPLLEAVQRAHQEVRGESMPDKAETAVVSMWRDTNVYNRAGIPALTFGPGRGNAAQQGTGGMRLDGMIDAAKMYALIALRMVNQSSSSRG